MNGGNTQDAMDDYEWTPPTEAELKVINAKRERADKISKLMGAYLLKGYKMLGSICDICGNILMKDRQQKDYCVACSELDTEHAKDDPALSHEAAASQVQEQNHSTAAAAAASSINSLSTSATRHPANHPVTISRLNSTPLETQGLATTRPPLCNQVTNNTQGNRTPLAPEIGVVVGSSVEAVVKKLAWASQELCTAHSVEASMGLCSLIKSCAETIEALNRLTPQEMDE